MDSNKDNTDFVDISVKSNNNNNNNNNSEHSGYIEETVAQAAIKNIIVASSASLPLQQQQVQDHKKKSERMSAIFNNDNNNTTTTITNNSSIYRSRSKKQEMPTSITITQNQPASASAASFSMLLPVDIACVATATETIQLIHLAENLRGWSVGDSIWHDIREVLCVRDERDRSLILNAFSSVACFRFPSDILHMLMNLTVSSASLSNISCYPVPLFSRKAIFSSSSSIPFLGKKQNDEEDGGKGVSPLLLLLSDNSTNNKKNKASLEAAKADTLLRGRVRATVHPGGAECFDVVNLPDELRVFELNTDWREHPEFHIINDDKNNKLSPAIACLLDQLMLGSSSSFASCHTHHSNNKAAAAAGTESCSSNSATDNFKGAYYDSKPFPCPFEIEKIPFHAIAAVCNMHCEDIAIELLKVYYYYYYYLNFILLLLFLLLLLVYCYYFIKH